MEKRKCANCTKEHTKLSNWCSEECFEIWYILAQLDTLNFVFDAIFNSRRTNVNS